MVVASATLAPHLILPSNSSIQRLTISAHSNSTVHLSFETSSIKTINRSVHAWNTASHFPCINQGYHFSLLLRSVQSQPSSFLAHSSYVASAQNDCCEETVGKEDPDCSPDHKMIRVCDKLIEVFMVDKPTTADWRRLLAFSKEWNNIRPHFYRRCQERADAEHDPGMKHKLFRLGRKLKEVDNDIQRHNELLEAIRKAPSEINTVVTRRRQDFTKEFFEHVHTVAESYYDNPDEQNGFFLNPRFQYEEGFVYSDNIRSGVTKVIERLAPNVTFAIEATREIAQFRGKIGRFGDLTAQTAVGIMNPALVELRNTCLTTVQAYDSACGSVEAMNAAELKFHDIINSPSLDAACKKIDTLAEKRELDSALMLMLTKAWSAAKESNMMKEEVKDILYHLYMTARGNLQRLMPKEIRILKYLLTIEDPAEQLSALKDAFTPGDELEGKDVDCLYTTPEKLHTWMRTVVDAYHFSREGTLIREARDLMNPKVIQRLEELKKLVEKNFM